MYYFGKFKSRYYNDMIFHMNENVSKRTFLSDFMMSIRKQNDISFYY